MRILYVGFTLVGDNDATGNTLNSIFHKSFFEKSFAQLCLDYAPEYHASLYPSFFISKKKSILYCLLKSFYRSDGLSRTTSSEVFSDTQRIGGNPAVALARAFLDILPKRISASDKRKIKEFSPDAIYTLGENISTIRYALSLSKEFNIPIVLHMMDNIEDCVYAYSKFLRPFRFLYLSLLNKLYKRSVENLAISPKMASEFSKRHGIPFSYAMNCVESLHCRNIQPNKGFPLKILFSGGLHGGRAETLKKIEKLIDNNKFLSQKFSLNIFTSKKDIEQFGKSFGEYTRLESYVPKYQMFDNLLEYDVLLHVESFRSEEMRFFEYSMSTKIPEYLSVGKPILCIGPECSCSVSFLKSNNCAIVETNEDKIEMCLNSIINTKHSLKNLGDNALEIASRDFIQENVANRVSQLFIRVIYNWKQNEHYQRN